MFAAIILLLVTGYAMMFGVYAGFGGVRVLRPFDAGYRHRDDAAILPPLFRAVAPVPRCASPVRDWAAGGLQLGQIRTIVTINLVLGVIVVAIGSGGRYWG